MDTFSYCFLLALVAELLLSYLTISNVTQDSMSISWKAQESAFDGFLIEVRNSGHLQEMVVCSVPAASRSSVINNLKASSNFTAHLHGLIGDSALRPGRSKQPQVFPMMDSSFSIELPLRSIPKTHSLLLFYPRSSSRSSPNLIEPTQIRALKCFFFFFRKILSPQIKELQCPPLFS